jgi:hypothetical protein
MQSLHCTLKALPIFKVAAEAAEPVLRALPVRQAGRLVLLDLLAEPELPALQELAEPVLLVLLVVLELAALELQDPLVILDQ